MDTGDLLVTRGDGWASRLIRLGAALMDQPNLDNHVAYLANWLKAMRDDPRFIFTASAQASKAADYLLAFGRPQTADEPEPEAALVG